MQSGHAELDGLANLRTPASIFEAGPNGRLSMSIEENKKIASEFAARFSANDMAGALDMIDDDASWWIAGKPGQVPGAGVFTKEQVAGLFRRMAKQFPSGLR